ncbi:MAG: hypothetical protein ACJ8E6_00760 [Sphingomicrobium sp.]
MNIERISRLLPACGDRWLPSIVAEAFTVEQPVPYELECILASLENSRSVGGSSELAEGLQFDRDREA